MEHCGVANQYKYNTDAGVSYLGSQWSIAEKRREVALC